MNQETNLSLRPDYPAEILSIVRSNLAPKAMRERLLEYHENDVAGAMEEMEPAERKKLYNVLKNDTLTAVLEYLPSPACYLGELAVKRRADVLSQLEPAVAVAYLEELPKEERDALTALMGEDSKREISLLASFDEDEIGSKITTNYIAVREDMSVRQAMHELVAQAATNDNVSTIYVIDEEDSLVGAIDLKDLIVARAETPLSDVIMTTYPYVYSNEPIDNCLDRLRSYSEDSIPVLDADNKLCGVLTAQVLSETAEEESDEDYARLGGLSAAEDLKEPLLQSIGKRLPWLMLLFALGLLVSGVVGIFETVVAHLSFIVAFQSLILGMAGNVGTQSLAVTIRQLSGDELTPRERGYLIFKESRVGICNGLILGTVSFILIGAYLCLRGLPPTTAFSVSFCTGIALLISMLLSSISGTVIPILFKRVGIDPAVASGPFITTINDLVAVVTYYGLSFLLLIQALHL